MEAAGSPSYWKHIAFSKCEPGVLSLFYHRLYVVFNTVCSVCIGYTSLIYFPVEGCKSSAVKKRTIRPTSPKSFINGFAFNFKLKLNSRQTNLTTQLKIYVYVHTAATYHATCDTFISLGAVLIHATKKKNVSCIGYLWLWWLECL